MGNKGAKLQFLLVFCNNKENLYFSAIIAYYQKYQTFFAVNVWPDSRCSVAYQMNRDIGIPLMIKECRNQCFFGKKEISSLWRPFLSARLGLVTNGVIFIWTACISLKSVLYREGFFIFGVDIFLRLYYVHGFQLFFDTFGSFWIEPNKPYLQLFRV